MKSRSQELTPTSQTPEEEQIRELVSGLQSLGSCSAPVVNKNKNNYKGKGKLETTTSTVGLPWTDQVEPDSWSSAQQMLLQQPVEVHCDPRAETIDD